MVYRMNCTVITPLGLIGETATPKDGFKVYPLALDPIEGLCGGDGTPVSHSAVRFSVSHFISCHQAPIDNAKVPSPLIYPRERFWKSTCVFPSSLEETAAAGGNSALSVENEIEMRHLDLIRRAHVFECAVEGGFAQAC